MSERGRSGAQSSLPASSDNALLVLGGGGMLGGAVIEAARARGISCAGRDRQALDLRNTPTLERTLDAVRPAAVINCAAFTDVDACEQRIEDAMEVNGRAVGRLARAVSARGAVLFQVSTDYVFRGDADRAYREDDETGPISVYGQSKLLGERLALDSGAAVVVRTSWLFGPRSRNFVDTILRAARSGGSLRVVDDQIGGPTYAPFLADALVELAELTLSGSPPRPPGVLHYRNDEPVSWYGLARAVLETWGIDAEVEPVSTEEFPRPARRPAYSVLSVERFERLTGRAVRHWREALLDYRAREEVVA
ncbi:MAG TPA: dTDP-4-dehydrorhamnose reductase [Thermoanaerobaculia bacterium]|nr:dTDP-4-dehydrorhamnose reductase [Thermoanaerobaculia bacterium]